MLTRGFLEGDLIHLEKTLEDDTCAGSKRARYEAEFVDQEANYRIVKQAIMDGSFRRPPTA